MKNILFVITILFFISVVFSCNGENNNIDPNDITTTSIDSLYTEEQIEYIKNKVNDIYNIDNIDGYLESWKSFYTYYNGLILRNDDKKRHFLIIKDDDKESVESERLLWNNQNIKNYKYTYTVNSNPPIGFITVTVKESEETVIDLTEAENIYGILKNVGEIYDRYTDFSSFVESFKDYTADSGLGEPQIIVCKIFYDTEYHYPRIIHKSVLFPILIDGGGNEVFKITDFQILD